MLVIIDNYDSFTYNIVQTVAANSLKKGLVEDIRVFRNDKITIAGIEDLGPDRLLVSPGPCTPKEAGISSEVIRYFSKKIPVLLKKNLRKQSISLWCMSRPPVHSRSIWWYCSQGQQNHARENKPYAS